MTSGFEQTAFQTFESARGVLATDYSLRSITKEDKPSPLQRYNPRRQLVQTKAITSTGKFRRVV